MFAKSRCCRWLSVVDLRLRRLLQNSFRRLRSPPPLLPSSSTKAYYCQLLPPQTPPAPAPSFRCATRMSPSFVRRPLTTSGSATRNCIFAWASSTPPTCASTPTRRWSMTWTTLFKPTTTFHLSTLKLTTITRVIHNIGKGKISVSFSKHHQNSEDWTTGTSSSSIVWFLEQLLLADCRQLLIWDPI